MLHWNVVYGAGSEEFKRRGLGLELSGVSVVEEREGLGCLKRGRRSGNTKRLVFGAFTHGRRYSFALLFLSHNAV
jgi:hypothetical protein